MCLSLYALLLRTLMIDLHAKNQHNICKSIEKVWKTVPSGKFTKSKVCNSAKTQCGATKLQLDLQVMMIDLHPKYQLNICKSFRKKVRKSV